MTQSSLGQAGGARAMGFVPDATTVLSCFGHTRGARAAEVELPRLLLKRQARYSRFPTC